MVAEPSGAAGLAALVQEPACFAGQTVGTIICGGNLTSAQMREWLAEPFGSITQRVRERYWERHVRGPDVTPVLA